MKSRYNSSRIATISLMVIAAIALAGCCCNQGDESAVEVKSMSIVDVTWQLAEVGGTLAEPVPADDRAAYLRLGSDKRYNGYSGINQFNGSYEHSGQSLKFGPAAMTRRAGPEPLMTQESDFTKAMTNTASWRAAGDDRIELLDAEGRPLAKLTRASGQ